MGISINGTPKLMVFVWGKSHLQMDDDWGYPHLWKPTSTAADLERSQGTIRPRCSPSHAPAHRKGGTGGAAPSRNGLTWSHMYIYNIYKVIWFICKKNIYIYIYTVYVDMSTNICWYTWLQLRKFMYTVYICIYIYIHTYTWFILYSYIPVSWHCNSVLTLDYEGLGWSGTAPHWLSAPETSAPYWWSAVLLAAQPDSPAHRWLAQNEISETTTKRTMSCTAASHFSMLPSFFLAAAWLEHTHVK